MRVPISVPNYRIVQMEKCYRGGLLITLLQCVLFCWFFGRTDPRQSLGTHKHIMYYTSRGRYIMILQLQRCSLAVTVDAAIAAV